jgi:succinoglycan biosynthesis protein ExoM
MPRPPDADAAIDVCIATFRRPGLLAALLEALPAQAWPGLALRLIVVDNDARASAYPVAAAFRLRHALPLVYQTEPVQNIALARNRALALATAPCIVFIDDDETPAPGWLRALYDCLHARQADAVFGPVHSVLPARAPAWSRASFSKPALATGTPLSYGGAGNVMLHRRVLAGGGPWFDPAFGLTGGEDTDWFYRLHLAGRRLVWCAEAAASEPVAPARLQLGWALRRAFRGGQTYYRVVVRRYAPLRGALWFALKVLQLLGAALALPLLLCLHREAAAALLLRAAGAGGQLARCLARHDMEEYRARGPR